jgi:hypothetical protein
MVNNIDSTGWMGRTKIQWILPEVREMLCNKIHNFMAYFRSKAKEGECYHFFHYFDEMQEKLENTWRIPPEVVRENQGIANFQDSRHNMWI